MRLLLFLMLYEIIHHFQAPKWPGVSMTIELRFLYLNGYSFRIDSLSNSMVGSSFAEPQNGAGYEQLQICKGTLRTISWRKGGVCNRATKTVSLLSCLLHMQIAFFLNGFNIQHWIFRCYRQWSGGCIYELWLPSNSYSIPRMTFLLLHNTSLQGRFYLLTWTMIWTHLTLLFVLLWRLLTWIPSLAILCAVFHGSYGCYQLGCYFTLLLRLSSASYGPGSSRTILIDHGSQSSLSINRYTQINSFKDE